ncbi:MAG: Mfa1 family fimbria major subunit [Bacteroides acidifaciens]|uniref:Mfa1 family fimbria major subunit n=1 Tax=Bacteroides acidifaciens TaxID=85831 RepID=UPI002149E5D8|nr:Mfa1 family fimbria major subunit [Bacteroides acidifaciens]MCR2004075.1 Mfa1 family fimbria major subunit [Bacteroides acidifaciens]
MKRFNQLMSLLLFAAVTQYSCINDADVAFSDEIPTESNGNLALSFEIPNVALTRSAESSGLTEVGSKEEYAVKSLTVYLFDSTTKTFKDQQELKNISLTGMDGQKIQYTADKITVNPGTYNIFAIANGKAVTGNISTQDAFLNAVDGITYSTGKIPSVPESGFVMTNRGAANLNVEVSKPTDSDKVTSVTIGLERAVAKVELTQQQETFPLKDPSGRVYCTIKLNNFRMLNLATQFYTFRHTAVLNEFQEPGAYTDENFGNINDNNGYVIDPYFFKKTVEGAKDFTNADGFFAQALVNLDINDSNWAGMKPAKSWSHIYCLENCMFVNAQLNAYSTGVMFKASMDIATDRVFDENGDNISNSSNWPTKLFYFNYNFYTSVDAIRKLVLNNLPEDITDNSDTKALAQYSIKRFQKTENYACYYNYWIKHEDDNNSTEMGVMEFGIVRNNIYRLSISKVAGLGSGEPYIEPEQPDEYKAEVDININVFPWAVRNQDVELE